MTVRQFSVMGTEYRQRPRTYRHKNLRTSSIIHTVDPSVETQCLLVVFSATSSSESSSTLQNQPSTLLFLLHQTKISLQSTTTSSTSLRRQRREDVFICSRTKFTDRPTRPLLLQEIRHQPRAATILARLYHWLRYLC